MTTIPEVEAKVWVLEVDRRKGTVLLGVEGVGKLGERLLRAGDSLSVFTPIVLRSVDSFPQSTAVTRGARR